MSRNPHRRVIILGPPGAGKGTQAKLLAETLGLCHIASGDLFRQHLSQGTPLGLEAKKYMTQGILVPDGVTIEMVLEELLAPASGAGFILDGFPRNLNQAERLDEALKGQSLQIDRAFLIHVPPEELIRRLTGRRLCRQCQKPYHLVSAPPRVQGKCNECGGQLYQRDDDTREAVGKRLQVYRSETAPVGEYYRRQGKLEEVQGLGSLEEVRQRFLLAVREQALKGALPTDDEETAQLKTVSFKKSSE